MKKRKNKTSPVSLSVLLVGIVLGLGVIFILKTNPSQLHGTALAQSVTPTVTPLPTPPPVICLSTTNSCTVDSTVAQLLKGKDLTKAIFAGAQFNDFNGTMIDLSNTKFKEAYMSSANGSPVVVCSGNGSGVNFSNDNFKGANLSSMQGFRCPVNFTNVNFTNANLLNSQWNGQADVTGVTWSNTICPDGTNSDVDGNTCVGHGF